MDRADLYLDQIDYDRYLSPGLCQKCGADSCRDLVEMMKDNASFPFLESCLPPEAYSSLKAAVAVEKSVPNIPIIMLPRPGPTGITELNDPGDGDPILVTGNSIYTQEVLLTVLSQTAKPFFLLCVDTKGDTLDMAVIFESFGPESVKQALASANLNDGASNSTIVIPGRAAHMHQAIKAATAWRNTEVGPVCAAELPLFFGDRW